MAIVEKRPVFGQGGGFAKGLGTQPMGRVPSEAPNSLQSRSIARFLDVWCEGEIRGLVLTYNQPARFDFRLESVPRKGVAQTFSLKAVDNLTVLSSGQQASAGTGGFWMRFIRGFRYRKLGIVSTLRNDTFTLNGTIHEGGIEYLVKKPALFGISVVNREPSKVISFKEMTGRLKRVGQSQK
jgi:hypothetical protein